MPTRGQKWKIAGALWHPNYQWNDTDYDQTAIENIPDDWEKELPQGGTTFRLNIRGGWDSIRGLSVVHTGNAAGTLDYIRSGRGLRGAVPMRENGTGDAGRFWVRGRYALSSGGALLTPIISFYNENESLRYDNVLPAAGIPGGLSNFSLYDESVAVPLDAANIGFWPSHIRLRFQFTVGAFIRQWGLGRWTCGYSLPSFAGGSQGWDEIICRPDVNSLELGVDGFGVLQDMPSGGVRVVDRTAGNERATMRATFNQARIADKRIFDLAWALRRGSYSTRGGLGILLAPNVTQSPIVLYPNVYDEGNLREDGVVAHEGFYAWITSRPQWNPVAFLGNAWRGSVDMIEAT